MPSSDLLSFTSYDLGRIHEAIAADAAERGRDAYGIHTLRAAAVSLLPWDHRAETCWDDPSFADRYAWLRARLVPESAGHDYPVGAIADVLEALVRHRIDLDDQEPF